MTYQAPVNDIMLALEAVADLEGMHRAGALDGVDPDTIRAVVEEAGKFGSGVLDPLNTPGDRTGCKLVDGQVITPPGWKDAYKQFTAGGWTSLPCPPHYGGQGLPSIVAMAACETWSAANLAFELCPMLSQGAIDAIEAHGTPALKATYIPKLVTGEWTGTMNLTEPHCGSDLGALKTRAERMPDGTYRIFGTKIFITYGEHDLADNIVHLVLARLSDAPAGTRGISLFVVPKVMVQPDGSLGARNDVVCAGLEHKLGIHASPTCVMKYGEKDGAVGYLVGEENRGLNVMFIMMNAARLGVGVQGVALAERATQRAIAYAKERRQGRGPTTPDGQMAPIIEHADIRRTLMTMKSMTQAARMICLATAAAADLGARATTPEARAAGQARTALLTPLAKAFSTDVGVEVASMGVQIHGGMGFIEETGAAQYFRDARILPIYEGTNGIQAIDLVTRKLPLEGGRVIAGFIAELERTAAEVAASNQPALGRTAERLAEANAALKAATVWLVGALRSNPERALAGATPYLRLFGLATGGAFLARGALAATRTGDGAGPTALARFFAENLAVAAPGLATAITDGADAVLAATPDSLAG